MSSDQSLDPQLVEQTRQQIRSLMLEISQLSKENLSPEEFYSGFLTRILSALAAVGGAIWTLNHEGRLALQYQINLQDAKLRDSEETEKQHGRLLYKVVQDGEATLSPPRSSYGEEGAGNPSDFLLVFGILKTDLETVGVVEIFQRPDATTEAQKGYLRFLAQMCELAADFLRNHQLRHFADRQSLWTQLEDFTRRIHSSLHPRETAYTVANEGRRLIECDRLSVAIQHGRKSRIEAISGQDVFDKRSNLVRLMNRLATAVSATGDPIWYSGDVTDLAPQVEEALQEYVDEAHSKTVAVLPLKKPVPIEAESVEDENEPDKRPVIAALIVEQIEDSRVPTSMVQRVDVVSQHAAAAMSNALEHQGILLMPLWRALGKTRVIVEARNLPKTISIGAAVIAVVAALIFYPAPFKLEAKGTLEPVVRREVFAGIDGVVDSLKVEHGSKVAQNQLLVMLRNNDLEIAKSETIGQITTTEKQINSLTRQQADTNKITREEAIRIDGQIAEAKAKRDSLRSKLELLESKQRDLFVKSPIDGVVVTWDLYKRLISRPVQRGQILMRVADPSGDWQLELNMPEQYMGHVMTQRKKIPENEPQNVNYILATEPGKTRVGEIKEVHRSAEIHGEEGNTVQIFVKIDKTEIDPTALRPGATVTAKVDCGRRALGYVLLHDVIAFIQSRILFRYF